MIEDIKVLSYYFDVITISDARLEEELLMPKDNFDNVKLIKIERPNFENGLTSDQKKSITEIGLDNFNDYDYVINNDSDLENLEKVVNRMLEEL